MAQWWGPSNINGPDSDSDSEIKSELNALQQKTNLTLQWIPSHCNITGNEKAEELSKTGSKNTQLSNPIFYQESKTIIIKSFIKEKWIKENEIGKEDSIDKLQRHDQVIIFRLRTGHCRLLSHLHRLKISRTDECPSAWTGAEIRSPLQALLLLQPSLC